MSEERPSLKIYTDGGADPNPGPGGWGAVLIFPDGQEIELSGGESKTTNNRMELSAAMNALKAAPEGSQIDLYTDSQYLKKGITQWVDDWIKRDWRLSDGSPVLNQDLWMELHTLRRNHRITWRWVRGHTGDHYNERAHQLASAAMPRLPLQVDQTRTHLILRVAGEDRGGVGRFGWAVRIQRGQVVDDIYEGEDGMTVNLMHLLALLNALARVPIEEPLQIFSNNSYIIDGITQWAPDWRARNWKRPDKFKSEWQRLDAENQRRDILWTMVKGELPEGFEEVGMIAREARDGKRP